MLLMLHIQLRFTKPISEAGQGTKGLIFFFFFFFWQRVPWTARKSNQSILKEISPIYSLEGLMLKLKLQYFGHLI